MRRAAAEALGRIGDDRAVAAIAQGTCSETNDRALRPRADLRADRTRQREYLKNSLDNESLRVRRACLTALDQLGEKLDPKVVLAAMKSNDAALKETAQWIVGRHPEWADEVVERLPRATRRREAGRP